MEKKVSYKYCIVPECNNTSFTTPGKLFFSVPKNADLRKKWCNVMKRDSKKDRELSEKSTAYCCEDHFSLEEDTENYIEHKLMGNVRLRLKRHVFPHEFACQKRSIPVETASSIERESLDAIPDIEATIPGPSFNVSTATGIKNITVEPQSPKQCTSRDIAVQIVPSRPKFRSKAILTSQTKLKHVALSPIIQPSKEASTSPFKIEMVRKVLSFDNKNEECVNPLLKSLPQNVIVEDELEEDEEQQQQPEGSASEYIGSESASSSSSTTEAVNEHFRSTMRESIVLAIEKEPKIFLGLPLKSYFLIQALCTRAPAPLMHVLITLKKIRLDDQFVVLAIHFGLSASSVSRIFRKTVPLLGHLLKELIIFPQLEQIRLLAPIPFRARYAKVVSIIDCLEIQIEKPSNPVHQSLTWSQYKGCNTMKYLISCTPDGLINYISGGYGGRATDVAIVEDCGFLNKLEPGVSVMADRGFKNISHLLQERGCQLIRPPSVTTGIPSTKEEVKCSKRIAALRIHVERVIGRLRDFAMLRPHACVDIHQIDLIDDIITISCAIVNLQDVLIKS